MQNVSNFYPLLSIRKIVSRSEILHFNARRLQLCLTIRFMQFLGTVQPFRGQNIGSEAQGYDPVSILRGDYSWILGELRLNWKWKKER